MPLRFSVKNDLILGVNAPKKLSRTGSSLEMDASKICYAEPTIKSLEM
jgi:hypothetical protein